MVGRLGRWFAEGPRLTRRQFLGIFALLFGLITIALTGEGILAAKLAVAVKRNDTAREFNCIQRAELDRRIAIAKGLLVDHPKANMLHYGGLTFSRSFVKGNLLRDARTRANMQILDCPKPPPKPPARGRRSP